MKNLFYFLILNSALQAQDYVPFIQNGNVWKYNLSETPMCHLNEGKETDVFYDYSLGDDVIINGDVFKEIYSQYYFKSLADFNLRKTCDEIYDSGYYLYHLDENNYNTRNLRGYLREDVMNKIVYLRDIYDNSNILYNYNNNNRPLISINNVRKFNIDTKEYIYDYIPYSLNMYFLYEGLGDFNDFFQSTFDHIDPPFSGLYAFSTDNGTTFYLSNNQVLDIKEIPLNTNYTIINNPSNKFIELNTFAGIKSIKILNHLGQILFEQMKGFEKINIENIPSGIYYLVIVDDVTISKLKFIKK